MSDQDNSSIDEGFIYGINGHYQESSDTPFFAKFNSWEYCISDQPDMADTDSLIYLGSQ